MIQWNGHKQKGGRTMKRLLFIYNPIAGQAQIRNHLHTVLDCFVKQGYQATAHPTQCAGDAREIAAAHGGGFDRVVCAGGDGTLHEVIGGLMLLPERPPIGYIPLGSTNDFSKNLRLPKSVSDRAAVAGGDNLMPLDVGRFQDEFFVYVAAFGMFTDVSYRTPQEFKNTLGHLAYLFAGVSTLANIRAQHITAVHDGGVVEGDYIYGMVGNTVSVGGFQAMREEDVALDDGLFEVLLLKMPENMAQWQGVLHCLRTQEPDESGAITMFRTKSVQFHSAAPVAWTLDGEFGGAHAQVTVENLRHGVQFARTEF